MSRNTPGNVRPACQSIFFLRQGRALLEGLSGELYRRPLLGGPSGSVGGQFRHCIDYYRCLLRDLDSGRIDYDRRQRDPALENEPAAAIAALRALEDELAAIDAGPVRHRLEVKADRYGDGAELRGEWILSSLEREMLFLLSHTVHHFALIALMLRQLGVEVDRAFGVAPSTLQHWGDAAPCAP
ncbi:MAG: hypothetical protein Q9Q13_08655 [Acidobacteriota bacterium]|nr:hypothetical protein [Acidobacteriota bacterium]